jgi:hypothetical protein
MLSWPFDYRRNRLPNEVVAFSAAKLADLNVLS